MSIVETMLVAIGRVIGKPPGWERLVHALAPPQRYSGGPVRPTRTADGYTFLIDSGTLIGWSVRFFGSYEPEIGEQLHRWLSAGDTAIDIGANVGWHALRMAAIVGPGGRVFAFEPNDSTRRRLLDGVAANRFTQVTVDPRAVASRSGTSGFTAPAAGHVWDGTGRLVEGDGAAATQVECVTLDLFTAECSLDRVALIKVDVEGWEQAVLSGAAGVLRSRRPVILFEYDPAYVSRCGGSAAGLTGLLTSAGYVLFRLRPRRAPEPLAQLTDRGGNFLAVPVERDASRVRR